MTIVRDRTAERKLRKKIVKARTPNQQNYLDSIDVNSITIGTGPAGTGKTFLAIERAVNALQQGGIERLILTRPAVEAGEALGFLPGDLEEKLDPYMRPLIDAIHEIVGADQLEEWRRQEIIEVAPLAFMRGRTLSNAFIILDEAQNTTPAQMKMFLTRMGFGSKVVVTGDVTQVDICGDNGLSEAVRLFTDMEDIGVVALTARDVVRHPLVSKILRTYDQQATVQAA